MTKLSTFKLILPWRCEHIQTFKTINISTNISSLVIDISIHLRIVCFSPYLLLLSSCCWPPVSCRRCSPLLASSSPVSCTTGCRGAGSSTAMWEGFYGIHWALEMHPITWRIVGIIDISRKTFTNRCNSTINLNSISRNNLFHREQHLQL